MVNIVKMTVPQSYRVNVLRVHTPVNDVKEQVGHGEYDSRVGVNHVAVAHYKTEIVF